MRTITTPIPEATQQADDGAFLPEFCPNPACSAHTRDREPDGGHRTDGPDRARWYDRHGSYQTAAFGQVPRFRCRCCRRGFSRQSFRLDYYAKRVIDYRELLRQLVSCGSTRDMARGGGCSTSTVANRIERLARGAAALHAEVLLSLQTDEPFVIDGFQNFAVSKYFPNNINILVGDQSGLLYDCDYRTIRRSGTMREAQKRRREALEVHYRADPQALKAGFRCLLDTIVRIWPHRRPIRLHSDCKKDYTRAIDTDAHYRSLTETGWIAHQRTLSTVARTRHNRLFVVNYLDRQLRKDLKECVRHTVCFARNVCNLMQRLLLYRLYHNHFKAFRHRMPDHTHAAMAGIDERWVDHKLSRLFDWRQFMSRSVITETDRSVWLRQLTTPLKSAAEYLPAFALG